MSGAERAPIRGNNLSIHSGPEPRFGRAKPCVLVMGASTGMGLACARAFAAHGAYLVLADKDQDSLKQAARELGGIGLYCDVASEASVSAFAAQMTSAFSTVDVLINAAGQSYVRTLGTMRVTRALMPMLERGGGRTDIVNIADFGTHPDPSSFPYAASTQAFASLSHALAEAMRGTRLVLTTIMPPREAGEWSTELFSPPHHMTASAPIENDKLAAMIVTNIQSSRQAQQAPRGSPPAPVSAVRSRHSGR